MMCPSSWKPGMGVRRSGFSTADTVDLPPSRSNFQGISSAAGLAIAGCRFVMHKPEDDCRMNLRIVWEMFRDDLKRIPFDLAANRVLGSVLVPRLVRAAGYRVLGADVSIRANIYPHVNFQTNRVTIGSAVMVNEGTRFANHGRVELQDNVSVGQEVLFLSDSHEIGSSGRRNGGADIDAADRGRDGLMDRRQGHHHARRHRGCRDDCGRRGRGDPRLQTQPDLCRRTGQGDQAVGGLGLDRVSLMS